MSEKTALLIDILEQAFRKRSWHGTNFLGSIRGLAIEQAAWRPAPARHNIWEQIVHVAYWKYTVWRRLTGADKGSFPLEGSDWFVRPEKMSAASLKADIKLLKKQHGDLIEAVENMPPERLGDIPPGGTVSFEFLITGVAAHDTYHTGQIQLLKRLFKERKKR